MQFLARGKLRASLHYKLASSAVQRNIYKNSPAFFTHSKPVLAGHAMLGWLKLTKDFKLFNLVSVITQRYSINADIFHMNDFKVQPNRFKSYRTTGQLTSQHNHPPSYVTSDLKKFEPYIDCLCDFIMTFLSNPQFIMQISHAKTFKMKYTRCPYNKIIQKYS